MNPQSEPSAPPARESAPDIRRRWTLFFGYVLCFPPLLQLLFGAGQFSGSDWLNWGLSLLFRVLLVSLFFLCLPRKNVVAGWAVMILCSLTAGLFVLPDLYLLVNFGALLDGETLRLMAIAPASEIRGFLRLFFCRWNTLVLLLLFPAAGGLIFRVKKHKILWGALGALTAAVLLLLSFTPGRGRTARQPSPGERLEAFFAERRAAALRLDVAEAGLRAKARNSDREALYILVIGVSHSRRRSSLYGCARPTTPGLKRLFKEGRLYRFDDAVSPHVMTHLALPVMLTLAEAAEPKTAFRHKANIPDIFRNAGFKVWYAYNQFPDSENELPFLAVAKRSDVFLSLHKERFDGVFVDILDKILRDPAPRKLVIFHLRGAHWAYRENFPPEARFFTGKASDLSPEQERHAEIIDDYDNALRYTDGVLTRLIERAAAEKKNAFLLYLPDHGEALYEEEAFVGHTDLFPTASSCEIPMVLWLSERYARPAIRSELPEAVKRPFSSEDLPHLLMELAGLESPCFRPERSVLNQAYEKRPRRISTRAVPYDSMKNKSVPTAGR